MNVTNNPRITVVTVCYNAADTIEKTIVSVINQTYQNIEYIIIDGASADGTIEIINKYRDKIAYFLSEPDKGIYDAMNKAIKVATGEWINFMNAGDTFYDYEIIQKIYSESKGYEGVSVLYGDSKNITKWGWYELLPDPMDVMRYRTPFCHQSSFIRTDLMKANPYDTQYKFAADFNFFHGMWKKGHRMEYIPITVSVFDRSSFSYSAANPFSVRKEEKRITGDNSFNNNILFAQLYFKIVCSKILDLLPFSHKIRKKRFIKNKFVKSFEIY